MSKSLASNGLSFISDTDAAAEEASGRTRLSDTSPNYIAAAPVLTVDESRRLFVVLLYQYWCVITSYNGRAFVWIDLTTGSLANLLIPCKMSKAH